MKFLLKFLRRLFHLEHNSMVVIEEHDLDGSEDTGDIVRVYKSWAGLYYVQVADRKGKLLLVGVGLDVATAYADAVKHAYIILEQK